MNKQWRSLIVSLVTILSIVLSMCSGILLMDRAAAQTRNMSAKQKTADTSSYIRNLTKLAHDGKLEAGAANAAVKRSTKCAKRFKHLAAIARGRKALPESNGL